MGKNTTPATRPAPVTKHRWLPKKQAWDKFLEPNAILLLVALNNQITFTVPQLLDMIFDACNGDDVEPDVVEAFGSRRGNELLETIEAVLEFMCDEKVVEYTPHNTSYTSLVHTDAPVAFVSTRFVGA